MEVRVGLALPSSLPSFLLYLSSPSIPIFLSSFSKRHSVYVLIIQEEQTVLLFHAIILSPPCLPAYLEVVRHRDRLIEV